MNSHRPHRRAAGTTACWLLPALLLTISAAPAQKKQQRALVPGRVELSKTVQRAVEDEFLTDAERTALRIEHGLFDRLSTEARNSARYALAAWDLHHPALSDADTPKLLRARAAWRRGDHKLVIELTEDPAEPRARLLRGRALAGRGDFDRAVETLHPLRKAAKQGELQTAEAVTAAARATAILARLEGRPARDYHFVMDLLGRAQQRLDRLHWPALIAQAELLIAKDNPKEAIGALHQALSLNPRCSRAWFLLGRVALETYNFDAARRAIFRLRRIRPRHVLAAVLETELYLTQKDPLSARRALLPALLRYPNHRRLLACAAAVPALRYQPRRAEAALDQFDAVSPGHPLALHVTGKYLSMARQYEAGEKMLRRAIERQPNWLAPRVELGLLLNQAGREKRARRVLQAVRDIDPFNKRAANTLKLLDELAEYQRIETEHFIVKYRGRADAALARDMPEALERIHEELTSIYEHEPGRKTLIEILPDKRWFAIRITGMPWIWTIGASTGPVIAMTPPRAGGYQAGRFDWRRVVRHEYVHTVTLSQTNNRIPHWFTEACAVAQERGPRDYKTCRLLAKKLKAGELFDLRQINWAFVRPKKKGDRALAYAQSHWMYQYITETHGHGTILKMLELAGEGVPHNRLIPEATGQSEAAFLEAFRGWAKQQVARWGLSPSPPTRKVMRQVKEAGNPKEQAERMLERYPEHPDLLRIAAERALNGPDQERAMQLLLRYADARPVDPWADRKIADLATKLGHTKRAMSHLRRLDQLDQSHGKHAEKLARMHRDRGELRPAYRYAERALRRAPYDAGRRELAATVALQDGRPDEALRHLKALTDIEPKRAVHYTRLAALHQRMGHTDKARSAAEQARKLDPEAPVDRFLPDGGS